MPSTAAFLFSDVAGIDSLNSDVLRGRLQAALTSAADGHAWDEWQDIALTHFLSETVALRQGAITETGVGRIVASRVSEFHAREYVPLAAYLTKSAGTLVATKAEVRDNKEALNARLTDNPDQRVVIDLPIEGDDLHGLPVVRMSADDIPENLRNLTGVTRVPQATAISDRFLWKCSSLTSLSLALPQATTIKGGLLGGFLCGCTGLTSLTLDLPQATAVGNAFLCRCTGLTDLTLDLPQATTIGYSFLYDCTGLTDLTLSLPQATTIEGDFLRECTGLTNLTLALPQATTIEGDFLGGLLYRCTGLTSLTLDLPQVTTIGERFLDGCTGLTSLSLRSPLMARLDFLDLNYLPSLTSLDLSRTDRDFSTILAAWRARYPRLSVRFEATTCVCP